MARLWSSVIVLCATIAIADARPDHGSAPAASVDNALEPLEPDPVRVVTGSVVDAVTGMPIEGAVIVAGSATAATGADGKFVIEVVLAERELAITAAGHSMLVVKLRDHEPLHVALAKASRDEVIDIVGEAPERPQEKSYTLTSDDLRMLPGTANDALRAAQALPGVARLPYSFGGLVLRGSSPRDNIVYIDGVEVPFAFHFGGVTSFFPSAMLESLTVSNGGLDPAFGRAQGGMVNLVSREPRRDRWRKGGSIGLLDAGVMAEGPWRSGAVMIGVRRSYFDIVAGPVAPEDVPLPSYWDVQLKASFGDPRKDGRVSPMMFLSFDDVSTTQPGKDMFEDESSIRALFLRFASPYYRQYQRVGVRIVPWVGINHLAFSSRTNGNREKFERPAYVGGSRAEIARDTEWGELRGGLDLQGGHLGRSQTGFGAKGDIIKVTNGETTIDWFDLALWGDTRFSLGDRMALKPGVRLERYGLTGEVVLDPRLAITQRLTPSLTLIEAVGRYHQPPTPGDVDPNGGHTRLESSFSDAVSLGVESELADGWSASATGYYSYGQRLGVRTEESMDFENLGGLGPTFELLLEKQLGLAHYRENIGRSRNTGIELLVKHSSPRWFGMLAYTLSDAQRTDDPRLSPGWRPFELDQRHKLNLAGSVPYRQWRFGARVHVVSGTPVEPMVAELSGMGDNLPLYFQIDLRADRRWRQCWGDVNLYFDIQNVTNRRNIEGRSFDLETYTVDEVRGLPIAPFIGVEFVPK